MAEIAATLGCPVEFEFEGKTYLVSPRDFEIEGLFELYLQRQALDGIKRHADAMGVMEYQFQMDGWRRDVATHAYSWGSPTCFQALCSTQGSAYLSFLQLRKRSKGVTRELVDRIYADKDAQTSLTQALAQVDGDPNPRGPGKEDPALAQR